MKKEMISLKCAAVRQNLLDTEIPANIINVIILLEVQVKMSEMTPLKLTSLVPS